jgi:hypothetical protein
MRPACPVDISSIFDGITGIMRSIVVYRLDD